MIDSLVQVQCLETDAEERILIGVGISGNINTYPEEKLRKRVIHLLIHAEFNISVQISKPFCSSNLACFLDAGQKEDIYD